METIGEKIRRIRKSKGISQMTVADTCNIKQSSYANIESGKTQNITIEIGKGIAKALDVSFSELFEIDNELNCISVSEGTIEKFENEIKILQDRIKDKELLINSLQNEKILFSSYLASELFSGFSTIINLNQQLYDLSDSEFDKEAYKKRIKINNDMFSQLVKHYKSLGFLIDSDIEKGVYLYKNLNLELGIKQDEQ